MTAPASHRDQIIGAIDDINLSSDLLRTAWLATLAEGGMEKKNIEAISSTLYLAITQVGAGSEALASVVGAMP